MEPFSTAIGAAALTIELIKLVDKVIGAFESVQNAPKDLRDFRRSVARLDRQFAAFQANLETNPSAIIAADDLDEIEDTLTLCNELFTKREASLREQGILNNVLKATWTIQNKKKLARLKEKIDHHYSQIIVPVHLQSMNNLILTRLDGPQTTWHQTLRTDISPSRDDAKRSTGNQDVTLDNEVIPAEEMRRLTNTIDELRAIDNKERAERKLTDLDETLERCWAKLGVSVGTAFDKAGLTVTSRRTSMLEFVDAPTTLFLHNVPKEHAELNLQRVHIMARDDDSRILQFQNRDASIHVTHIVPFGSIPLTRTPTSHKVSFIKPHIVTVVDGDGYHLYNVSPQYRFDSLETCNTFQETLRERKLLGAFEAVEISESGAIVASRQVIRLWLRDLSKPPRLIITMSYLQNSRHDRRQHDGTQHKEIDVGDLRSCAEFRVSIMSRREESEIVDVRSRVPYIGKLKIKFETAEDAKAFKRRYDEVHPSRFSGLPPRSEPVSPLLRQSSPLLQQHSPPKQLSQFSLPPPAPSTQLSPASTAKTTTASSAPASIWTTTPRTTPGTTPSDATWNTYAPSYVTALTLETTEEDESDMLEGVLSAMNPKEKGK